MDIDIIIPVLDEEKFLKDNEDYYRVLSSRAQIIFVDGGSRDKTVDIAKRFGEVIHAPQGRSLQKNTGAQAARAPFLLFLHVDTLISLECLSSIERTLRDGYTSGCLTMQIEDNAPVFRVFETVVNFRAKHFKVVDGDCGQFIKRQDFISSGPFDDVPIMEDILFSRKMRHSGRVAVLPDIVRVSARRWKEDGFIRVFLKYCRAYFHLWTGQLSFKH